MNIIHFNENISVNNQIPNLVLIFVLVMIGLFLQIRQNGNVMGQTEDFLHTLHGKSEQEKIALMILYKISKIQMKRFVKWNNPCNRQWVQPLKLVYRRPMVLPI